MDELRDLRPSLPTWLRGILLAELALLVLIVEVRVIAEIAGVPGLGALYLFVRGALFVMPFGALMGGIAPLVHRHRVTTLWASSLVLLALTGLALLLSLRGFHAVSRTAEDLAIGLALLVLPVGLATSLFVRWTPVPSTPLDLSALLDTFE